MTDLQNRCYFEYSSGSPGWRVIHKGVLHEKAFGYEQEAYAELRRLQELDKAVQRLTTGSKAPAPDVVKHVYYSGGLHCLEVNGTRGDRAGYEAVALHPAGYLAVTDYYVSGYPSETVTKIPEGGKVWKISDASWTDVQTVKPNWESAEMKSDEAYEFFKEADKAYDRSTPHANQKEIDELKENANMDPKLKRFIENGQ